MIEQPKIDENVPKPCPWWEEELTQRRGVKAKIKTPFGVFTILNAGWIRSSDKAST